jgi:hypothetical protein
MWYMTIVPAMQEAEMGESLFETASAKKLARLYVKNKPGVVVPCL